MHTLATEEIAEQRPDGLLDRCDFRSGSNIHLRDLATGTRAGVDDVESDVRLVAAAGDLEMREAERGVRQTSAEGEQRWDSELVVEPITREDALILVGAACAAGRRGVDAGWVGTGAPEVVVKALEVRTGMVAGIQRAALVVRPQCVRRVLRPGHRGVATRVCEPQEQPRGRRAALLSGEPHLQH